MPVVRFTTSVSYACPEGCSKQVGGEDFADSVNHLVEKHGYKIRHIGQETHHAEDGGPWHSTAAVLEK